MKKEYLVKKINETELAGGKNIWNLIPGIKIACYPWDKNGYKPVAEARLLYTNTHFHIYFKAYEKQIRASFLNLNEPVCRDSCVEFFFNPNPEKDGRYLNFEMNPLGTLLLGIGKGRENRILIDDIPGNIFRISTSETKETVPNYQGEFWTVQYSIPFTFIENYYAKIEFNSGKSISANFYKCGDHTHKPHYGCWSPVYTDVPDFHRPEFFGRLILE